MLLFQVQFISLQATNLHMNYHTLTLVKPGQYKTFKVLSLGVKQAPNLGACLVHRQAQDGQTVPGFYLQHIDAI